MLCSAASTCRSRWVFISTISFCTSLISPINGASAAVISGRSGPGSAISETGGICWFNRSRSSMSRLRNLFDGVGEVLIAFGFKRNVAERDDAAQPPVQVANRYAANLVLAHLAGGVNQRIVCRAADDLFAHHLTRLRRARVQPFGDD